MSLTDFPTKQEFIQAMSKAKVYSFNQLDWHSIFTSISAFPLILLFVSSLIILVVFFKRNKIIEVILKKDNDFKGQQILFSLSLLCLTFTISTLSLQQYISSINAYHFYQSIPNEKNPDVIHSEISATNNEDLIAQINLFQSAALSLAKNELQHKKISACLNYDNDNVSNIDRFMNCLEKENSSAQSSLNILLFLAIIAFSACFAYIDMNINRKQAFFNNIAYFFKKLFKLSK